MDSLNADRAVKAIQAERAQIGHEIHDSLLPQIAGVQFLISAIADRMPGDHPDRENLQKAIHWLADAQEIGRKILVKAYPPELERTTWIRAAQDTISRIAPEEISVHWDIDEADSLPIEVAGTCYRIVVEAVSNAIRHSDSNSINVKVLPETITISDQGKGFDSGSVAKDRYGLRSMKGRAALIGARLEIMSTPGQGTTLSLHLPK